MRFIRNTRDKITTVESIPINTAEFAVHHIYHSLLWSYNPLEQLLFSTLFGQNVLEKMLLKSESDTITNLQQKNTKVIMADFMKNSDMVQVFIISSGCLCVLGNNKTYNSYMVTGKEHFHDLCEIKRGLFRLHLPFYRAINQVQQCTLRGIIPSI